MEFVKSDAEIGVAAAKLFMTNPSLLFLSQVVGFVDLPKPKVL